MVGNMLWGLQQPMQFWELGCLYWVALNLLSLLLFGYRYSFALFLSSQSPLRLRCSSDFSCQSSRNAGKQVTAKMYALL